MLEGYEIELGNGGREITQANINGS